MTEDPTAEQRKKDHIDLAFDAQLSVGDLDNRFYYEPLFSRHPDGSAKNIPEVSLAGKTIKLPLWVSSMTGGTAHAATINQNLARASANFGMGMGLGSCRILLHDTDHFKDFDVRSLIGVDQPLFANMGIAQLEDIIAKNDLGKLNEMVARLDADGLIIHVNPLQEWFQPEGDSFPLRRHHRRENLYC